MSKLTFLALAAALVAEAHEDFQPRYQRREPSRVVPRQGPPYPTGPGYDVTPLESIVALPPDYSQDPVKLPQTFNAGSQPPIANAPQIPQFNLASTPWPQDWTVPPPIDSPQVKEWLKELDGHTIPNIAPNKQAPGSNGVTCGDNPGAVATAGKDGACWWTCGGCLRDTDISTCKDKMTWGQTFDDGPGIYTPKLLTYLDSKAIKATFFVIGGNVLSRPETVVYEHMTGHEVGVHTWSHPALTTLTNEQIVSELGWCREAIKQVIGVTPLLFRPPYGDIDDRVRAIANAMGLIPVLWTSIPDGNGGITEWDSNDWRVHGGTVPAVENQNSFYGVLDRSAGLNNGIVVLQHDVYKETVDIAIGATIPHALGANPPFTHKSIQVCQGNDIANAYKETTKANPPIPPIGGGGNNSGTTSATTTTTKGGSSSTTRSSSTTSATTSVGGTGAATGLKVTLVSLVGALGATIAMII